MTVTHSSVHYHQPGDLWAHKGNYPSSCMIKWVTWSNWSHISGIATVSHQVVNRLEQSERLNFKPDPFLFNRWRSRSLVFQSTTLSDAPCVIQGRHFSGVQANEPSEVLRTYEGEIWRLRLNPRIALNEYESERLSILLLKSVGLPYDHNQAALSGTRFLRHWLWSPASMHHVFCSELWATALMQLGKFQFDNPSTINPGRLVNTLVNAGVYQQPERIK